MAAPFVCGQYFSCLRMGAPLYNISVRLAVPSPYTIASFSSWNKMRQISKIQSFISQETLKKIKSIYMVIIIIIIIIIISLLSFIINNSNIFCSSSRSIPSFASKCNCIQFPNQSNKIYKQFYFTFFYKSTQYLVTETQ